MKKLTNWLESKNATATLKEFEEIVLTLFEYKKMSYYSSDFNIDKENTFVHWLDLGSDFHVDNVITSFHALLRKNTYLDPNDYLIIQTCLTKLGETTLKQTSIVCKTIWTLDLIPNDTPTSEVFKLYKKIIKSSI